LGATTEVPGAYVTPGLDAMGAELEAVVAEEVELVAASKEDDGIGMPAPDVVAAEVNIVAELEAAADTVDAVDPAAGDEDGFVAYPIRIAPWISTFVDVTECAVDHFK
jgi:hypothetical protein